MATKRASKEKKTATRGTKGEGQTEVPEAEAEVVDEKPLRPFQCRGYLRKELAGSFRGIVKGFVDQAKAGSVQHLKVATALLEEPATKPRRRGKGSAELLLERMRRASEREGPVELERVSRE